MIYLQLFVDPIFCHWSYSGGYRGNYRGGRGGANQKPRSDDEKAEDAPAEEGYQNEESGKELAEESQAQSEAERNQKHVKNFTDEKPSNVDLSCAMTIHASSNDQSSDEI